MKLGHCVKLAGGLLVAGMILVGAGPARAHEAAESDKAADLIRQAIALVVNEPSKLAAAREKIADAREAKDQTGVDVAFLEPADGALAAGDAHRGRAFLEAAIGARPHTGNADPAPIRETSGAPAGDTASAATETLTPTTMPMQMASGAEPGTSVVTEPLDARPHLNGGDWALLLGSVAVGLFGLSLGLRFRPAHRRWAR